MARRGRGVGASRGGKTGLRLFTGQVCAGGAAAKRMSTEVGKDGQGEGEARRQATAGSRRGQVEDGGDGTFSLELKRRAITRNAKTIVWLKSLKAPITSSRSKRSLSASFLQ